MCLFLYLKTMIINEYEEGIKIDNEYKKRVYRALLNLKISGEMRKTRFFYKQVKKGRFGQFLTDRNLSKLIAIDLANNVDKIISILNNKLGDMWDLHYSPIFAGNNIISWDITIIIRYPEFTISNSSGNSRPLKDLLVTMDLTFSGENLLFLDIKGLRHSFSVEEIENDYIHSHLTTIQPEISLSSQLVKSKSFCLGESEVASLLISVNESFSEDLFEALLYSIDTLVEWESLEGIPFTYICDIIETPALDTISLKYITPSDKKLLDLFSSSMSLIEGIKDQLKSLTFKILDNKVIIQEDSKFSNFLKFVINKSEIKYDLLYITKQGGNFKISEEATMNLPERIKNANDKLKIGEELPYFYFREEKKEYNIYTMQEEEDQEGEDQKISDNMIKVHPIVIKKVKEYYEQEISKQLFRASANK